MQRYIIDKIGNMYLDEVTADDLKLLMVPVAKMSAATYSTVNMLIKSLIDDVPDEDAPEHHRSRGMER